MSFYQKLISHFNQLKNISPPARLKQKRPYIVPIKFGFSYALAVLFMIGIGFNYANNLVYLVAFFLASVSVVVMHLTNYNMQSLYIKPLISNTLYAGQENTIQFELEIINKKICYEVEFTFDEKKYKKNYTELSHQQKIELNLFLNQRGWIQIPDVTVQSRFPFGFFRAWKKFKFEEATLVYPQRKGQTAVPSFFYPLSSENEDTERELVENHLRGKKNEEPDFVFKGHRPFQTNDSFKRADWKAYARIQKLLVKEFETENTSQDLELHYRKTNPQMILEDRISQLALWVDLAEKSHKRYSLILPDILISAKSGSLHYHECMRALAELKSL